MNMANLFHEGLLIYDKIEEVELPFEDTSHDFPATSSSIAESLDISGLYPFVGILASFLDSFGPNTPIVNNVVANAPF